MTTLRNGPVADTARATQSREATGPRPGNEGDHAAKLAAGYAHCAQLTRAHGTTYWWGTQLLAPEQRRDVYAVYALCRLADDIVDEPETVTLPLVLTGTPAERLDAFEARFRAALAAGTDEVPTMAAIAESVLRRRIPLDCFDRFFHAMHLDLVRTQWNSWEQLRDEYMEGSAAVIGEMMLPVLAPAEAEAARDPARALGLAFQLTNFIRDVAEDLDRGRVYMPADRLAAHGVDLDARRASPEWRAFAAEMIELNRGLYREALPGVAMLPPVSARCVGAALRMYAEILCRIERYDYDVFSARRRVSRPDKVVVLARVLARGPVRTASGFDNHPPTSPKEAKTVTALVKPAKPVNPIRRIVQPDQPHMRSTWRDASPARIARSLDLAEAKNPGGWLVAGASTDVPRGKSIVRTLAGREVVLWRTGEGELVAGPGACPHMGARLDDCQVDGSALMCRWHGLAMQAEGDRLWSPYRCHDDGVLAWVQLPVPGEEFTDAPIITARPDPKQSLVSVVAVPGRCEPSDIIANRLDPWHGAWFHPYAFSHLVVDEEASTDECLVTDVTFRLGRTFGIPVRAVFACPDARTIVMTITEGEGEGSVVETHATPLGVDTEGHPVTMMVENVVAHSPRSGFEVARKAGALIRPAMRRTQRQLWVDDLTYAERRYTLRARQDAERGIARR